MTDENVGYCTAVIVGFIIGNLCALSVFLVVGVV